MATDDGYRIRADDDERLSGVVASLRGMVSVLCQQSSPVLVWRALVMVEETVRPKMAELCTAVHSWPQVHRHWPPYQPCPQSCASCSACIAAEAHRRRGGRPYLGLEQESALAARGRE